MNIKLKIVVAALIMAALPGCGGGGGSSAGQAATGIRILHAAIDITPAEVVLSSGAVIAQERFGGQARYFSLPTGKQGLVVRPLNHPENQLGQFEFNVNQGERRSILVTAAVAGFPARAQLIEDFHEKPPANQALLRIVHGLAGAAGIVALVDDTEISESISFGSASAYAAIGVGQHQVSVVRAVDRQVATSVAVTLEAGRCYSLLAAGEQQYFAKAILFED